MVCGVPVGSKSVMMSGGGGSGWEVLYQFQGLPPTPAGEGRVWGTQGSKGRGGAAAKGVPGESAAIFVGKDVGELSERGGMQGKKVRVRMEVLKPEGYEGGRRPPDRSRAGFGGANADVVAGDVGGGELTDFGNA
jgi:hypothetical protein